MMSSRDMLIESILEESRKEAIANYVLREICTFSYAFLKAWEGGADKETLEELAKPLRVLFNDGKNEGILNK